MTYLAASSLLRNFFILLAELIDQRRPILGSCVDHRTSTSLSIMARSFNQQRRRLATLNELMVGPRKRILPSI
jgi:hypothetical protein